MVSPTSHNINTAASNQSSSQTSFTETERSDQASSSEGLPLPPKGPIDIKKYLQGWDPDPNLSLQTSSTETERSDQPSSEDRDKTDSSQNPYGHETADSNPSTPESTSSEGSELSLGAASNAD